MPIIMVQSKASEGMRQTTLPLPCNPVLTIPVYNQSEIRDWNTVKWQVTGQGKGPSLIPENPNHFFTKESHIAIAHRVDDMVFVKAWMDSIEDGSGMAGVSKKTGLQKSSCQVRASRLRTVARVDLPRQPNPNIVSKRQKEKSFRELRKYARSRIKSMK